MGESVWFVPEGACAVKAPLAAIDSPATIPHSIRIRVIRIVLTIESRHRVAAFASLGLNLFPGLGRNGLFIHIEVGVDGLRVVEVVDGVEQAHHLGSLRSLKLGVGG